MSKMSRAKARKRKMRRLKERRRMERNKDYLYEQGLGALFGGGKWNYAFPRHPRKKLI